MAEGKDWDVFAGVVVTHVEEGSPADQGGLREDDVILEFDARPVEHATQFRILVAGTPVGKTVPVKVYRGGKHLALDVTLGEFQEESLGAVARATPEKWLGLDVVDAASPEVRERFELPPDERGVVITGVEPGSPAAEQGLEPGGVILQIINQDIAGIADYNRIREDLREREKPITLKVKEGGTVRYVVLTPRS
jgi:serine protease Do